MLRHLDMVKCATQVQRFEKDTIVIQAGDTGATEMYVLLKGNANAYNKERQLTASYKIGDFFGERTLFLGQIPTESIVAADDIIALPVSRKHMYEFFAEQPEATFFLIQEIFRRAQQELPDATKGVLAALNVPVTATATSAAPAAAMPKTPAKTLPKPPPSAPVDIPPSELFPSEHTHHELEMVGAGSEYLFMKGSTCPVCGHAFKHLAVKKSKLIPEKTDSDLRVHYSNIEPMHYDVVTCPKCWYSALGEMFKDGTSSKAQIEQLLKEHRGTLDLKTGEDRDSLSVFAGYYLALICAPRCFRNVEATVGKLWIKLSRLYDDCKDETMSLYAAQKALEGYLSAYEKSTTPPKQNQQLLYIIGELSLRLNDLTNARKFLFQAKVDKDGSAVLTRHAEDRIEYLRELPLEGDSAE